MGPRGKSIVWNEHLLLTTLLAVKVRESRTVGRCLFKCQKRFGKAVSNLAWFKPSSHVGGIRKPRKRSNGGAVNIGEGEDERPEALLSPCLMMLTGIIEFYKCLKHLGGARGGSRRKKRKLRGEEGASGGGGRIAAKPSAGSKRFKRWRQQLQWRVPPLKLWCHLEKSSASLINSPTQIWDCE